MIDTLLAHRERARALAVHESLRLEPGGYGAADAAPAEQRGRPGDLRTPDERHRPDRARTSRSCSPCIPGPGRVVGRSPTAAALVARGRLRLLDPLGYLEFIGLMEQARIVLTDSGGIQEETTILGVPCLTLRENTERPVTVTHGTNRIVGTQPESIVAAWRDVRGQRHEPARPPLWDGGAARRIVDVLTRFAGH